MYDWGDCYYIGQKNVETWLSSRIEQKMNTTIMDFKENFKISDQQFLNLCNEFSITIYNGLIDKIIN